MKRKINTKPIITCWDMDDTLWRIRLDQKDQVPDFDLIMVMRWFWMNGHVVNVWSAGGIDYATQICRKLGIDEFVDDVIAKGSIIPDIAFDDELTKLAKVDVHVQRDTPTFEERHN